MVKQHIALSAMTFVPNTYLAMDNGPNTGQACNYTPPANQTSIATVQAIYGSNYTVTRLYPNKDIFKVHCTVSPYCDVYDGAGNYVPGNQTYYLSNTQRIAYRYAMYNMPETYARTTGTLSSSVAQADVSYLVTNYFGGYVVWVDYSSNPVYTSWFN